MDYKVSGNCVYARFDKGDEVLSGILDICKRENILSATFSGIGGCGEVSVGTLNPLNNEFIPHNQKGMLEMVSLNGSVTSDDANNLYQHSHAMFSYLDNEGNTCTLGGHLQKAIISYTAEIVINPVQNGVIKRMIDPKTGITVWKLND